MQVYMHTHTHCYLYIQRVHQINEIRNELVLNMHLTLYKNIENIINRADNLKTLPHLIRNVLATQQTSADHRQLACNEINPLKCSGVR